MSEASQVVRMETLSREDVAFLREMIVSRSQEVEKNTKLDHNERKVLTDRYKRLAGKLNRRFPLVSTLTEEAE